MFRNAEDKSDGEISSDDDEPMMKNPRHSLAESAQRDRPNAKKNPWGELIIERELDKVARVQVEEQLIERDSESFAIPPDADFTGQNSENQGQKSGKAKLPPPMIAVSPADEDDPFAGPPEDITKFEKFGFDPRASTSNGTSRKSAHWSKRGGSDKLRDRIAYDKRYTNEPRQAQKGQTARGMRGSGPRGMTMRGRSGPRGMSRGGTQGMGRGGGAGTKRTHEQMKGLRGIIASEYSVEKLLAAEFEEDLTMEEFGREMASALGEKDPEVICNLVKVLGKDLALRIFEKTRDVEASGGMMVNDGSRRRAPGGVFMMVYKDEPSVSQHMKDEISALTAQKTRMIKKAKRRKQRQEQSIDEKVAANPEIDQENTSVEQDNKVAVVIESTHGTQEVELDYG